MGVLDASDLAFIEKFENCGFQKACWNHEAHVRMAWIQLSRSNSFHAGLDCIREGIKRFNNAVSGVGYHETVTVVFAQLIHFRMEQFPSNHTWASFLAANTDLLAKAPPILSVYYSSELLASIESKVQFVKPDRRALPPIGRVRLASPDDATSVLGIYAPYVKNSAVSFELTVPTESDMRDRISSYLAHAPWLVFEIEGKIVGYAYASKHRAREAYQWTVEVSAYVDPEFQKMGIARLLYSRLFGELQNLGFRQALAGIALPNEASVGFHETLGFIPVGVFRKIGFKMGGWHDVGWWQRPISNLNIGKIAG